MTDGPRPRMSGRIVHDPALAAQETARQQGIHDAIHSFAEGLPMGDTQVAPQAIPYTQPDATTCYYASIAGIATSMHGRNIDLRAVGLHARDEGLLGQYGAETFTEFQERQVGFARRYLSLSIRFINRPNDAERVHAVTEGLAEGRPVLFGLPNPDHWIALDGVRKFGRGSAAVTWKGMNPYPRGRRIEDNASDHLSPERIAGNLIAVGLPIVVVEGTARPRFSGRVVEPPPPSRFRPAGGTPGRRPRMKKAE